jgi:hypothetical protein
MMNVADQLLELRADGVLILAAERGLIVRLRCEMPVCLIENNEGREYFEKRGGPDKKWAPSADHFPIARRHGGSLTPDNIRLAHRLCNTNDYQRNPELAADRSAVRQNRAPYSPEAKAKMSESAHRRWEDPEQRKNASEKQRGKKPSVETSEKKRAAMNRHFEDPAAHERVSEGNRRRYEDPKERIKSGDSARGRKASSETRAKMSVARKKHWDKMTPEERSLMMRKAAHTRDHVNRGKPCPPTCIGYEPTNT